MVLHVVIVVYSPKEALRGYIDPEAFRRAVEADLGAAGKVTLMAFETGKSEIGLFARVRRELWQGAGIPVTVISM